MVQVIHEGYTFWQALLKVVHVHHDLGIVFLTLVWNDEQSFFLCHFRIIILPVLFCVC